MSVLCPDRTIMGWFRLLGKVVWAEGGPGGWRTNTNSAPVLISPTKVQTRSRLNHAAVGVHVGAGATGATGACVEKSQEIRAFVELWAVPVPRLASGPLGPGRRFQPRPAPLAPQAGLSVGPGATAETPGIPALLTLWPQWPHRPQQQRRMATRGDRLPYMASPSSMLPPTR